MAVVDRATFPDMLPDIYPGRAVERANAALHATDGIGNNPSRAKYLLLAAPEFYAQKYFLLKHFKRVEVTYILYNVEMNLSVTLHDCRDRRDYARCTLV